MMFDVSSGVNATLSCVSPKPRSHQHWNNQPAEKKSLGVTCQVPPTSISDTGTIRRKLSVCVVNVVGTSSLPSTIAVRVCWKLPNSKDMFVRAYNDQYPHEPK